MDTSMTSDHYISISDDVINKSRSDLVFSGELEESVLSELHACWRRKMIQAGVINGTIETSFDSNPASVITHHDPYASPGYGESGIDIDAKFPSTDLVMSIKNENDELYIPQQDGASDGFYIPQLDGVTKPNTSASFDDDDENLNENDDYEEDGNDDDKDIPHMIMCQFEHVKKRKNKWECKLKAGAMKINEKSILFSEAKGEFIF